MAASVDRVTVSLMETAAAEAQAYGCRCASRLALGGKKRRALDCGATAAAVGVVRTATAARDEPLLLDALTALLNVSSEPANQVISP